MMASAGPGQRGDRGDATPALSTLVKRHKILLIVPPLLALAFGWIVAANLPRRYAAEAVLALDARKVQIVQNEVVSGLPQENAPLRTELDIITSRSLAEQVVDRLGLISDPGTIKEIGADRTFLGLLGRIVGRAARGVLRRIGVAETPPDEPRPLRPDRSVIVDWLIAHLAASNDNRSLTIIVTFDSESPERAARIANAVAEGYLDDQVRLKAAAIRKAGAWLAEKLGEMRQEVAVADAAVADFRRSSGLIEAKGATVTGQQLSELNSQLVLARTDRARAEGRLQMTRMSSGGSVPDVLAAPSIQQLRAQLSQAEVVLAEAESSSLASKHFNKVPELEATVNSLKRQIGSETARIVASVSGEVEAARAKEAGIAAAMQRLQAEYGSASTETVRLNQLEREAEADHTIYEKFLSRYKETVEQEGLAASDARLITEAQASIPAVSARTLPILLLSGVGGMLFGCAMVAVRAQLDDRIHDFGKLDEITRIPILGAVPRTPRLGWRKPYDDLLRHPGSPLGVALQWLQAALQLSSDPQRAHVILVTSAMAAEGKTSLCVCLARELARTGVRVLLIDADPYRPRVAAAFGSSSPSIGLRTGEPRCFEDLVQADARSGAHFVAAPRPEEFHHLIRCGALARLVEQARGDYDVVILDVPPVVAGAGAAMIGRVADTRLFVVRCGRTRWDRKNTALACLRICGSVVDGIVVTDVDRRHLYHRGIGPVDVMPSVHPPLELSQ